MGGLTNDMRRIKSPFGLIITLVAVIFLAESLIMVVIDFIYQFIKLPEYLLDPILLVLLLSPALFFFIFKPMIQNLQEREKAFKKLDEANRKISDHRDNLEKEVERKTKNLQENLEIQDVINSLLKLSVEDIDLKELAKYSINIFLKSKLTSCVDRVALIIYDREERYISDYNAGLEDEEFNNLKKIILDHNFENKVKEIFEHKYKKIKIVPININGRIFGFLFIVLKEQDASIARFDAFTSLFTDVIGNILKRLSYQFNLADERKELVTLFQSVLVGVITTDKRGIIRSFNNMASEIFGYSPDEVIGKNIDILIGAPYHLDYQKCTIENLEKKEKQLLGKARIEFIAKRKNGDVFPIELSVNKFKLGNEPIFVASISDISKRKQKEYQLLLRNSAIDAAANAIIITNIQGTIIYANSAFTQLTGYTQSDIIGKSTNILKSGKHNEEFYQDLWNTIKSGNIWSGRMVNKKKNGELYDEEMTITPVKDENGQIINFIAVKQDVSQKVERERRIKLYLEQLETQKNQLESLNEELKQANISKDKFFSIIAHDLKSPFSALLGYTQIFREDFDELSKDEIKTFTESISEITKNIYQLLLDLLDWARLQTGRMEIVPTNFNLYMIILSSINALKPMAEKKKIEISFAGEKNSVVFADENMIKTVLRNLISNAIKFTHENGKISITVHKENDKIITCVEDNGVGISEEHLDKMFKFDAHHTSLGTADEKGTGLGLILCKEMIEKNGGEIWVESELGKGSKFYFSLKEAVN